MSELAAPLTRTVPSGIQDLSTHLSILFMIRSSRTSTAWPTFCPFAALVSKYGILCQEEKKKKNPKMRVAAAGGGIVSMHYQKDIVLFSWLSSKQWITFLLTNIICNSAKYKELKKGKKHHRSPSTKHISNVTLVLKEKVCPAGCFADGHNVCFTRRTDLAWHFPAQTLANNAEPLPFWQTQEGEAPAQTVWCTHVPILFRQVAGLVFAHRSLICQVTLVAAQNHIWTFTVGMNL